MDIPLHPAVRGLVTLLPPHGSRWPTRKRLEWLAAFRYVLDQVYPVQPPPEPEPRTVYRAPTVAPSLPPEAR